MGRDMSSSSDNELSVSVPGPDGEDLGQLPEFLNKWADGEISWEEHTELANGEVERIHQETLDELEKDYKAGRLSLDSYEWEKKLVLLTKAWGLGEISTEEYQRRHDELMNYLQRGRL